MGLDMYLFATRFLGWNEEEKRIATAIGKIIPFPSENVIDLPSVKQIGSLAEQDPVVNELEAVCVERVIYKVAYWRKANAIHQWFVDNVQSGEDDCRPHELSSEKLSELVDLCKKVLENRDQAPELLPTQSGFFFGGTEYDEWYFKDLENTVKMLTPLLSVTGSWYFEYQSSW